MRAAGERVAGEEQGDIGEGGLGVQIRAVQCQAVSGAAGITPLAVVRRTWLPMTVGMVVTFIANAIFIA